MSNLTPTKVDDAGLTQLIQRLGRDCTPSQFVREFTKNAIEAVQRTDSADKNILIDANWEMSNADGVHKISFTDNGDGMSADEMRQFLNNLSSSGHENDHENYGVGAKISALTRNHEGIFYESWKDGVGNAMTIVYDRDARAYGIKPVDHDGMRLEAIHLPAAYAHKPPMIDQHGTRVTLLGMTLDQDTMLPPSDVRGGKEEWLRLALNTRFFSFPAGIEVKVRIAYFRPRTDKQHNYTARVNGQSETLSKHAAEYGSLKLSDARAHWWILKEDRGKTGGREFHKGHTGSLNQNELFDLADGRVNKAAGFGITFGKEDVVIYIEPGKGCVQNTARTGLLQIDGSPLPWDRWQDEFRAAMPKELSEYVRQKMAAITNSNHEDSIKARLKNISKFFKISRYRKLDSGSYSADPDSIVTSRVGIPGAGSGGSGGRKGNGTAPGSQAMQLLSDLLEGGVPAEAASPDKFPKVTWVKLSDGSRDSDEMDDRAAMFLPKDNLIKAHADFQGFTDMIEHFSKDYMELEGAEQIIKSVVQETFEQQLVEVVTGAMSLKNRPKWTSVDFEQATCEEALTTAVMSRYHLVNFMKRQINNELGKVPTTEAVAPST